MKSESGTARGEVTIMRARRAQLPEKQIFDCEDLRPPLKWAGGKRWLVPQLRKLWESHNETRLVEPFCGGLSVALGLQPEDALLNDLNAHVINFYRHVRRGLKADLVMKNDEGLFYLKRDRFNELIQLGHANTKEAAELFYFLNRTCFNGLCRFNRSGEFNVPFGKYSTINYRRDFLVYKETLRQWSFKIGDFEQVALETNDFVYADPPYDVEFTQYSKDGFTWDDQIRLAEWLSLHRGPVVLSNQATPRVMKLYRKLGFKVKRLRGPRLISCTGDRTSAEEVLATRNL